MKDRAKGFSIRSHPLPGLRRDCVQDHIRHNPSTNPVAGRIGDSPVDAFSGMPGRKGKGFSVPSEGKVIRRILRRMSRPRIGHTGKNGAWGIRRTCYRGSQLKLTRLEERGAGGDFSPGDSPPLEPGRKIAPLRVRGVRNLIPYHASTCRDTPVFATRISRSAFSFSIRRP